jgi:hypothetical protein
MYLDSKLLLNCPPQVKRSHPSYMSPLIKGHHYHKARFKVFICI